MKNAEKLIAVALIFYITGMAAADVGTVPECTGKPLQWWMPIVIFSMMAIPSALCYFAGLNDRKD